MKIIEEIYMAIKDLLQHFISDRKHHYPKVLFICKEKLTSGGCNTPPSTSPISLSTGLYNSAYHIVSLLRRLNIDVNISLVVDNNSIDREVTKYRPDVVIIEALWVVPEKFDILKKLHPNVKWVVRIHSKIPFLSLEGNAIDWMYKYLFKSNLFLGVNNFTTYNELQSILPSDKIFYMPNYYEESLDNDLSGMTQLKENYKRLYFNPVNIGCFGAIRPLKNHLIQAIAAIEFGDKINENVCFHVNTGRLEGYQSTNILKNMRALFNANSRHNLIEHEWLSQKEFFTLLNFIDIGTQVSLSESFNLVTADLISHDVPVIVSKEISWMPDITKVDNDVDSIVNGMLNAYYKRNKMLRYSNKALATWNCDAKQHWKYILRSKKLCT